MIQDLLTLEKETCCGCSACASICPKNAITMSYDTKGFLYPQVNPEKCVGCKLCLSVCDFKNFKPTNNSPVSYAVRHKSETEVATSRSGGFMMALSEYVIEKGGVIFGCALENPSTIIHKYANDYESCKSFKGSKYVQSDVKNTFVECADFLKSGRAVLYSGTACQVHGLLSFLNNSKISTDNLITCDIVCHGVPSPGIWNDYITTLTKKLDSEIISVDFREKQVHGWASHIEKYTTEIGSELYIKNWTELFYAHVLFRESCYNCKYTTPNRLTDFTIADYWGIEKQAPEFADNKGVSLVIVGTDKGDRIFASVLDKLNYKKTDLGKSLQPNLIRPSKKGKGYKRFWKSYTKNKQKTIKKYLFPNKVVLFGRNIKNKLKPAVKKILKKLHIR